MHVTTSSSAAGEGRRHLERLDELQSELIATVAHEIRDPMASAIGFAQMLLTKGDRMTGEERREALEAIVKSGRRLVQLLDDILDVSRLESGATPLDVQPVDLNEIVTQVLEELRGRRAGLKVEFEPSDKTSVDADRDRMHQVIANLLSNALKFSEDDAPIAVTVSHQGDEGVVAVRDEGIGIAPQDVSKLFGPFARLTRPGSTDETPGSGLGLYISKRIVDAHQGRIWVDSEPGKGSTFFVALPLSGDAA